MRYYIISLGYQWDYFLIKTDGIETITEGKKPYNISSHEKPDLSVSHCCVLSDKKLALKYLMVRQFSQILLDFSHNHFFLFTKRR